MTSLTFICITKMASYQLDVFMWFDRLVTLHMHTKFRFNRTSGFWDAKQRECVCGRMCVCVCVCVCVILYTKTAVARNAVVTPLCKASNAKIHTNMKNYALSPLIENLTMMTSQNWQINVICLIENCLSYNISKFGRKPITGKWDLTSIKRRTLWRHWPSFA